MPRRRRDRRGGADPGRSSRRCSRVERPAALPSWLDAGAQAVKGGEDVGDLDVGKLLADVGDVGCDVRQREADSGRRVASRVYHVGVSTLEPTRKWATSCLTYEAARRLRP